MECLQQLTCSNRLMVVTKNSFSVGQSCRVRDEFLDPGIGELFYVLFGYCLVCFSRGRRTYRW